MSSYIKAARIAAFVKKVFKAFFGITSSDTTTKKTMKVGETVMMRVIYSITDYWLMALSGAYIIFMDRYFGYGPIALFVLMWAFDIVVAAAFVLLWKKTGKDITLGVSYRRAAQAISEESKIAGYLAFIGVIVKAAFWDGPEHIICFFHKEIRTRMRILGVLLSLTALQAAIWTPIYVLGFDGVTELYSHLIN